MRKNFVKLTVGLVLLGLVLLLAYSIGPDREKILQQIDAFEAADASGRDAAYQRLEKVAPGWERFRAIAGAGAHARDLFAGMVATEHKLLRECAEDPPAAAQLFVERCEQYQRRMMRKKPFELRMWPKPAVLEISYEELLALLFAAGNEHVPIPASIAPTFRTLFDQNTVVDQLKTLSAEDQELLWKLFSLWLERPLAEPVGHQDVYRLNHAAMRNLFPAASVLATRVLKQAQVESWPAKDVDEALMNLRICEETSPPGGPYPRELILALEAYLDDHRVVIARKPPIELRDRVLAALLHVTSQDRRDYGIEPKQEPSPETREKAFARWREWSHVHIHPEEKVFEDDAGPAR